MRRLLDDFKIFGPVSDDSKYVSDIGYLWLDDGRLSRVIINGEKAVDNSKEKHNAGYKQG